MAQVNFKFVSNTKGLQTGLKKSEKSLKGFQDTTKKVSGGIGKLLGGLGLAFGASALISGLTNATKAAAEDLKQQKLLAGQLKRTTKASDAQVKGAERFVQTLSEQTGILDDDLRPALSNAVRGSGSLAKGQKLLQIALDGSVASGKPLDTVLNALIKANNGNTQSLYRLAPELKNAKGGIDDYAKSVEGAAKAGADPFAKFNVAIENLTEQFGAQLLPYVETFVTFLTEQAIPALSDFIDDASNPNTDVGKTFIVMKNAIVGPDGKSGIYGAILEVTDAIGKMFAEMSSNGNTLDGFVKSFELIAFWVEATIKQISGFMENPLDFPARLKTSLESATRFAEIYNRPSLFGPELSGGISAGNSGLSPRITEGITGQRNYTININKANMTPQEIIAAIKQYERQTGRTP